MYQITACLGVVIVTAQCFDLRKPQPPTNSLVNLGKIDVAVYYNSHPGKPGLDNDILMAANNLQPHSPSCPCAMKSFGKDASLSVLNKLFGGVSMVNDVPLSSHCCDTIEIFESDNPFDILTLHDNNIQPFQNSFPFNLPLPKVTAPKNIPQIKPKAVEILILPNKKNNKIKYKDNPRDSIRFVGGDKKVMTKIKRINKPSGLKKKENNKFAAPPLLPLINSMPFEEYDIIPNVEIMVESRPIEIPISPELLKLVDRAESSKNPSVKKDLNFQTPSNADNISTTTVSAVTASPDTITTGTETTYFASSTASPMDVNIL